jgi:hypothetical protein
MIVLPLRTFFIAVFDPPAKDFYWLADLSVSLPLFAKAAGGIL